MDKFTRYITALSLLFCCCAAFSPGTVQGQNLGFRIGGATVLEKDTFTIAVTADSLLTGKGVYSYRFGISYNSDYLEFLNIDSVGVVLKSWGIPTFNKNKKGRITIAGAGTTALTGNGAMFYLRFKALRGGATYVSNISGESYLNEGLPAITFANGYINAQYRSYPDIYPDSKQLFVGEEVQMYVSGGTAPYIYKTMDTAVAVISSQTIVKAKGPGVTRAYVTDGNGEKSYMTGDIDVRAVKMYIMRSSAWPGDSFYLPVKIEIAPGTRVYSGYFEISYNPNVTGVKNKVNLGDYNISVQSNSVTNLTKVSFASASGLTGSGILCYLGFKAVNSGNHYFYFQNLKFNEKLLAFSITDFAEVYYLPALNISPNSGTLMWGTTEKITVTNGSPPISYQVTAPLLGNVDLLGNLTGTSGGKLKIIATDSHGATKTSGDFTILDNNFSILNSDGILDNDTRVPLSTSALPPGKLLYDFDGMISFNQNEVEFKGLESLDGAMLTEFVQTNNTVHIVGATSSGIQSGIIGYLKFRLKNTVSIGQQVTINLNSMTGNESTLFSTVTSGKITRVEQLSYRPVARAGINKSVPEGEFLQLDGSQSYDEDNGPGPLSFLWIAPAGITLSDNTVKNPSFTAPDVNSNKIFTFKLVVNDGESDSDTASVSITVLQINRRPFANAGPDKSFFEGTSVSLDGSLSGDPDKDVISYKWTSLDGIILFDPLSVSPSFITPQVNADKVYRFKLEVSDGVLYSIPDTQRITVLQVNKKPVAFAGGDQTVNENTLVQLDGSLSSDPDDEPVTFKWITSPVITLSSNTISKPTFTAPFVHRDSVVTIALVVNDGKLNSDTDKVLITIKNLNILSNKAKILSASLAGADSLVVDSVGYQVKMYLPYGTDPVALAPAFEISHLASVSPASGSVRNFSTPQNYTVTAEDGITKKVYAVKIIIPGVTLKRTLNSGWNWISLSAVPDNSLVENVMAGLTLQNLDYIKTGTSSAVYYSSGGWWYGDLTLLPQLEMLMFKKAVSEEFTLSGKEINPTVVGIPVSPGWNRIGNILKGNAKLSDAFDTATLPAGDIILKSKEASAVYYPSSGWAGDLDSIRVLHGYMMKTTASATLKYKASAVHLKSMQQPVFSRDELYSKYKISPNLFENSLNLIGEVVNANNENITGNGDLLMAFVEDEVRGVTEARFIPDLKKYVFILTVFSNSGNEKLKFSFKSYLNDNAESIVEELTFSANEVFGKPMFPATLHLEKTTEIDRPETVPVIQVFPNPVDDKLQIFSVEKIHSVTISGISGSCVKQLSNIDQFNLQIETGDLVSGIYMLKIETSKGIVIRKLVKSSNR